MGHQLYRAKMVSWWWWGEQVLHHPKEWKPEMIEPIAGLCSRPKEFGGTQKALILLRYLRQLMTFLGTLYYWYRYFLQMIELTSWCEMMTILEKCFMYLYDFELVSLKFYGLFVITEKKWKKCSFSTIFILIFQRNHFEICILL
jgi:hypothetical protein